MGSIEVNIFPQLVIQYFLLLLVEWDSRDPSSFVIDVPNYNAFLSLVRVYYRQRVTNWLRIITQWFLESVITNVCKYH